MPDNLAQIPERPVLLTQGHVIRALADPAFFERCPEFSSLRVKMTTMHADLLAPVMPKRGCSSCKQSRVGRNLYGEFLTLVRSLSPDGLVRLKLYFGIKRLMLNLLTREGRAEMRVF